MASEEAQYSSGPDSGTTNKRKYDDASPPSARRPTGFSAPILPPDSAAAKPSLSSYNSVAPPATTDFELAKQRAQEIAARLLNSAEAKRSKIDSNGGSAYDSPAESYAQKPSLPSFTPPPTYGYQGQESKSIDVPNGKVGVIIGKGGDTIKQLQAQSGAKIQVTRDMDADPYSQSRKVDLMGTPDQISRAEQLIKDVLAEAEMGGTGSANRRVSAPLPGAEQYVTKIPNNKVGLVIGKGGETIKNMQAQSNARIQVIPLHLPPGDPSTERTLQIDGTPEQIEIAKQLVNEVISEGEDGLCRSNSMIPPISTNRVRNPSMGGQYSQQGYQPRPPTSWAPPGPPMQQPAYNYMQQQGAYSTTQPQYNMSQPQYPGYPPQPAPGGYSTGWDPTTGAPTQQASQVNTGYDNNTNNNSGYNYAQYNQQAQGYSQDGYGYSQPQTNPSQGYDQQGYGYGGPTPTTTDGTQGETTTTTNQAPPPVQPAVTTQQGYGTAAPQAGYGVPTNQAPPSGYGPQGYGPPQPAAYGAQPGYGAPPPYGAPAAQAGYGQMPPAYGGSYGGGYAQPPAYAADTGAAPGAQAVPPAGVTQASPKS